MEMGFLECLNCGNAISTKTDDFYNSDHSEIRCPECGGNHWIFLDDGCEKLVLIPTFNNSLKNLDDRPGHVGFRSSASA